MSDGKGSEIKEDEGKGVEVGVNPQEGREGATWTCERRLFKAKENWLVQGTARSPPGWH